MSVLVPTPAAFLHFLANGNLLDYHLPLFLGINATFSEIRKLILKLVNELPPAGPQAPGDEQSNPPVAKDLTVLMSISSMNQLKAFPVIM